MVPSSPHSSHTDWPSVGSLIPTKLITTRRPLHPSGISPNCCIVNISPIHVTSSHCHVSKTFLDHQLGTHAKQKACSNRGGLEECIMRPSGRSRQGGETFATSRPGEVGCDKKRQGTFRKPKRGSRQSCLHSLAEWCCQTTAFPSKGQQKKKKTYFFLLLLHSH